MKYSPLALLAALTVPFISQAAENTMYGIKEMPLDNYFAKGVDNKGNVLANYDTKQKGKASTSFCKRDEPQCRSLSIKYGGGRHPSQYVYLWPDVQRRIATVGRVYVKDEWYAAYKHGLGTSRFHNDEVITPGIAYGVANDKVVGETTQGHAFLFVRYPKNLTILPTLGGAAGSAQAINLQGVIVGDSTNSDGVRRATKWVDGLPIDMGVLADGGQHSSAKAINDSGLAVGCADRGPDLRRVAVKFENGTVLELGVLGTENGNEACATVVTRNGLIAGWSTILPNPGTHPFIMEGGNMVNMNDRISENDRTRYELVTVGGANSTGQLVVTAKRRSDSMMVPLLLTPLP